MYGLNNSQARKQMERYLMIIHWTESRVHKEKWAGSALQISRSALLTRYTLLSNGKCHSTPIRSNQCHYILYVDIHDFVPLHIGSLVIGVVIFTKTILPCFSPFFTGCPLNVSFVLVCVIFLKGNSRLLN